MIGKTLGSYRVIEQIGMGGMANVYKAYDPNTDRYVALKVLPERLSADPDFRKRFRREAKAIAKLEHLHILPIFAYGEEDDFAYLVMRYIETGTLSERVERGPLSLDAADRLLGQIASALDYAHERGILHRDVKPSNVLLDEHGNSYLTDFGIAKIVEATIDLTGDSILGTPKYMSPEQCRGEKNLTPATDIYSLGIVLFEMLTGRPPFEAETPIAVIHMQLHEPLPLPRSLRPDLPEEVEKVILKALAKEPEQRYESAQRMAEAFQKAVQRHTPTFAERPAPEEIDPGATIVEATEAGASAPPQEMAAEPEQLGPTVPAADAEPQPSRGIPRWAWWAAGAAGILVLAAAAFAATTVLDLQFRPATQAAPIVAEQPTEAPAAAAAPTEAEGPTLSPTPNARVEAAMADPWGPVAVPPDGAVTIGLALAFEAAEPAGEIAFDQERAALLAVDEFGPISGFQVEVTPVNSGCSADGGEAVADSLLREGDVVGVIGTTCSSSLETAMRRFNEAHIVFISPSSTADHLRNAGLPTFHRVALRSSVNPSGDGPVADPASPEYQAFASRFEAAYGTECCQAFAAEAYDAMGVLLSSIDTVAVVNEGGDLIIPRRDLARAVRGTEGFVGASGMISFDDLGDRVYQP